jgi:hypothetical protein
MSNLIVWVDVQRGVVHMHLEHHHSHTHYKNRAAPPDVKKFIRDHIDETPSRIANELRKEWRLAGRPSSCKPPNAAVIRVYMTSIKNKQYHMQGDISQEESVRRVSSEATGVEYIDLDPFGNYVEELDVMGIIVTGILHELDSLEANRVVEIALDGTCKLT